MGLRRNLLIISALTTLVGSRPATAQFLSHFRVPRTRVCFPPASMFSGCDVAFSSTE